jgi:hypothetical protein
MPTKILRPLPLTDLQPDPEFDKQLVLEDKARRTFSQLMGYDGQRPRLIRCTPGGSLSAQPVDISGLRCSYTRLIGTGGDAIPGWEFSIGYFSIYTAQQDNCVIRFKNASGIEINYAVLPLLGTTPTALPAVPGSTWFSYGGWIACRAWRAQLGVNAIPPANGSYALYG